MSITARISLPSYDVGTDTNLDHYSLYADVDNVLIKEYTNGSITLGTAGQGTDGVSRGTIAHNLGYTPFYLAYTDYGTSGTAWYTLNNQYNLFSVPQAISAVDNTNLYLYNFLGSSTPMPMQYRIFYDDMTPGTPSFTQSDRVFKVTRPGKDGTSTNPNDYIMHSDLNNFKIIISGSAVGTFSNGTTIAFPHNGSITNPVQSIVFFHASAFDTMILGAAVTVSDDVVKAYTWADTTNIYVHTFNLGTANLVGTAFYYLFGKGIDIPQTHGEKVIITPAGIDAGTVTNPDNTNYHSDYSTLKYYTSGSIVFTNVTATKEGTFAHNLGYTPFFTGFVNDIAGIIPTGYASVPYYLGKSTLGSTLADIGAFMRADGTNLYAKAWFDVNASGTYNFTFYYKIFKNRII